MLTYFLLFQSIHAVLRAEKILKTHALPFELVPVPRNLSSDCGVCIKFAGSFEGVKPLVSEINMDRCFSFDGSAYKTFPPDK